MTYRAKHVTQKDGSAKQWENCRMAVLATHLDFHTEGGKTSTGKEMRSRQSDQVGGTDAYDAQRAWKTYAETLVIRNGKYWADLVKDREKGWWVSLDVWYAQLPDRCQTNGNIGHTIGIAPETDSAGQWLVSDPLCSTYKWMKPSDLRRAAEAWGARLKIGKAIAYTTAVQERESVAMETINTGGSVSSTNLAEIKAGVSWYYNDECTEKGGTYSAVTKRPYIGATKRGTRAVIQNTKAPYDDGIARDTIVYMKAGEIKIVAAPPPPDCPDCPECPDNPEAAEIIAERDAEWVAHLTPPLPAKTP